MTGALDPTGTDRPWWRSAVIYQIYPRSFQDSDGDGVGDLAGITARLDHVATLGIDAIWISPIYPSPMADFGYDVADHTGVDPLFGTLADFDRLLEQAHARGLKVLLDFVPNHSSDRHPWFLESRSSRENPKRDWYIWRDPKPEGGDSWGPPNNWISDFGGPAWEWDAATGQYYYHAMMREQPDLNWRNPALKAAMLDAMRFWFDRGVDGFRIDILWHLIKAEGLPDNPVNADWHPGLPERDMRHQLHSTDQPEVHALAAEMRAIADRHDALLVGEIYLPIERVMAYYGTPAQPGVHLPFNFQLIDAAWDARSLAWTIAAYEAMLPAGAWPNWVLGNHDQPRVAARLGARQARVAAMLLLTLRGTPTLYQGDEIGIGKVAIPADRMVDPRGREGDGSFGRDPARTPMAWDATAQAGFTTGEPWLPLHDDWPTRNVAEEAKNPASMLSLHRRLLALRRAHPALAIGDMAMLAAEGDVLAFTRMHGTTRLVVALNLGGTPQRLAFANAHRLRVLLSTTPYVVALHDVEIRLAPDQGLILFEEEA